MQSSLVNSTTGSIPAKAMMPLFNGRPDPAFAEALKKVSPQAQAKAKATATDFEAMFLNSMFSQMTSGIMALAGTLPLWPLWIRLVCITSPRCRLRSRPRP